MNRKRINKNRRASRFGFILGGLLLLMNGIIAIGDSNLWFGLIQIAGSILNFAMLLNIKSLRAKQKTEDLILLMNSLIALIIAIEYFQAGGKYIQYVWMLTSILYILVLIIKKRKTMDN